MISVELESALPLDVPGEIDQPPDQPPGAIGLVEMLLKSEDRVDRLNRSPVLQGELFPRFLLISQASTLAYGAMMVLVINLVPRVALVANGLVPIPPAQWDDLTALALPLSYNLSTVLAACVCLPSFYFYCLLAGVPMTWLQIVSLVGKGMAASAIMLLGILPIYVALVLGLMVFNARPENLHDCVQIGLILPFIAGLWGLRGIYRGIFDLNAQRPLAPYHRRDGFLRRLVVSWAAVYTTVLPVMIYRLWELFAASLRMG
jgi:hypothetical protein